MKLVKILALAVATALLFVSCTKNNSEAPHGNYVVTCDKEVSLLSGSGIIFNEMSEEVAKLGYEVKTAANDKAVIAATDKVYEARKDQASEAITISVGFKEGNVSGKPENTPVVIKTYKLTPVE